jgi:hypothetical protein
MGVFKGQKILEFSDCFKTDGDCKEYLALAKAKTVYKCLKFRQTPRGYQLVVSLFVIMLRKK